MKRTLFAVPALALGLTLGSFTLPAHADSGDLYFEMVFKMADQNKDGAVTKKEFLDTMAKVYDMKMDKMKAAKDSKMMKGDAMTRDGLKSLFEDIYKGA